MWVECMNKLYNKSELWFSLVFILIYVVGASVCDALSNVVKVSKIFTFPFLLGFSIVLFFWIRKNSLMKKYGLCKPNFKAKNFLYYVPLLILISTNLWLGVKLNYDWLESLLNVLAMICVGFVEEIIFRGFLFRAMEKNNAKSAIIVSSLTFGLGHFINLFSSGFNNLLSNTCQVCYAIAVGFLFVVIFYKGGSLISCIITHSLVNALSVFQNSVAMNGLTEILISIAIIIVATFYAVILLKTLKSDEKQNKPE